MTHEIHRVTEFEQVGTFVLRVRFEDGTERVIDFEPILEGGIYAPLRDPDFFRKVELDSEAGTLVWPNGADFDPATLYEWPDVVDELAERTKTWDSIPASR